MTGASSNGNILELTNELAALNITPEDVYSGKICMSDDVLVQNFGLICKQTVSAKWYNDTNVIKGVTIPKTGDAPLNVLPAVLVALAVISAIPRGIRCFKQKEIKTLGCVYTRKVV